MSNSEPLLPARYFLASGSALPLPPTLPALAQAPCTAAGPGPATETYLAVAVASQLRDEADMIIPDLNHLLTDVVLGADATLSACPPGEKTTGVVYGSLLQAPPWDRLLLHTSCFWSSDNIAGSSG